MARNGEDVRCVKTAHDNKQISIQTVIRKVQNWIIHEIPNTLKVQTLFSPSITERSNDK